MKSSLILVALMLGGLVSSVLAPTGTAAAADVQMSRYAVQRVAPPFPRSERAQSVWASGACWSECGSYCAWGMTGCLEHDAQGQCVKLTDRCDRYCQRECRTSGGPLVPDIFDAWN